ncbi:MAG: WD40/YVTN/BNR-like repeat-containing protein, partial [Actinomycetota bacterium]
FLHGLYVSETGGGWADLTPGCLLPPDPPSAVPPGMDSEYRFTRKELVAITGLDACAVEGIAYDGVLPNRMYVAAYDVTSLRGTEPTIGPGGVYVSDTLGVSWRKLIGGIRGNGLAVWRDPVRLTATIVVGYIQASNGAVGSTPDNGSLMISDDDGMTWRSIVLPPSGCADIVDTSQRITPTVVIDPKDPSKIFAGTNAGLYASSDGGVTWTLARAACGGVWGIALTPDGSTIYIGDKDGIVSKASVSTLQFSPLVDLGAGKIQSLVLDPRDAGRLYAAMWSGADANVYAISAAGSSKRDDSLLREVIPLDQTWPAQIPKPFPLAFKSANGAAAPSLFLQVQPALTAVADPLYVSTIFRGVFVRSE